MAAFSPLAALFLFFNSDRLCSRRYGRHGGIAVLDAAGRCLRESETAEASVPRAPRSSCWRLRLKKPGLRRRQALMSRGHLSELKATPTYGIFWRAPPTKDTSRRPLVSSSPEPNMTAAWSIWPVRSRPAMVWPIKLKPIPLGATDAAAFSKKGIRATCLISQDTTRLVPNYPHSRGHAGARAA